MLTKADISFIRSLSDKKHRMASGLFVVEGRKMVEEALASSLKVGRVLGTAEFARIKNCEVVSAKDIERMSSLKTPQGILALVEIPRWSLPASGGELSLALDNIQDPGNMGTIVRLADWFGIRDIICSADTVDCFNPKVVQATMGAIFRVRVHYTDLPAYLASATTRGEQVYGTFLEGEPLPTAPLGDAPTGIIVMGNEGNGISSGVADSVTKRLYIPSFPADAPSSESLNVATATAILLYHFRSLY